MIEKLTKQQEIDLIKFKEKWLQIGLCCEPADKKKAEKYLTKIYKENLKLDAPYFWWVKSPYMGSIEEHNDVKVPLKKDQVGKVIIQKEYDHFLEEKREVID